jgi:hypothetical protein
VSLLNQLEKENLNPDQFFIKIFSEYLENLKKRKFQKIYSYVWVAEKTKQGVLHFHCIFDTPYLCAVGESRSWSYKCGMENFSNSVQFGIDRKGGKIESKYQNLNPEGISAYLTKYVSKNQSLIFGRNYAMSKCFFKASKKGVQKFFNPVFVYNNPKEKKGNFIIDPPWYSYDSETNRYYKRKIYLPVDVLNENSIELPSGAKIPIFTLVCKKKEKLLKLIFPDLYYRSSHLFDKPEIEQGEMALAY